MSSSISSPSTSTTSTSGTSQTAAQNAFSSLSDNFQGFLQMLMTQLQNQDPTTPMDSSQFTSELVQFSSVEQQISTNSNLAQLIQLTQSDTMVQAGQIVGKQVQVTSDQLSLQNGTAGISFTTSSAEPVAVTIADATGQQIYSTAFNATPGANTWTWNGQNSAGVAEPDGAYKVTVATTSADNSATAVPFAVTGTVTGVTNNGSAVQLRLGQLSVAMSDLTSMGN